FTGDDVTVQYRDPFTAASFPPNLVVTGAANITVIPLNAGTFFGPGLPGGTHPMATSFFVRLNTPLSGVGTYSYAISSAISDRIRSGALVTADQWASSVIDFSSQFTTTDWSAAQTLGPPNTLSYGDIQTAWSASFPNGDGGINPEFLTLGFGVPVQANG